MNTMVFSILIYCFCHTHIEKNFRHIKESENNIISINYFDVVITLDEKCEWDIPENSKYAMHK